MNNAVGKRVVDTPSTKKVGLGAKLSSFGRLLVKDFKKHYVLYFMLLPGIVYYIVFHYIPMYGTLLAFKDFNPRLGILGSPWADNYGFENFIQFFKSYNFWSLIGNTITINLYSLVVTFPCTIIFALLLNYIPGKRFKKTMQMVSYAPHFISVVVICGMLTIFLQPESGIVNAILKQFGVEPIAFLQEAQYFKSIFVLSGLWQSIGWGSIIYISALAGVDESLHEAAKIDGATKLQRIINIDFPSILPTVIMLLILQIGKMMNLGYEKIFLLQNDLNRSASDVISTFVYRVGLINSDYSYSTAIGLFNSVVNIILLITFNKLAKKFTEQSLW